MQELNDSNQTLTLFNYYSILHFPLLSFRCAEERLFIYVICNKSLRVRTKVDDDSGDIYDQVCSLKGYSSKTLRINDALFIVSFI